MVMGCKGNKTKFLRLAYPLGINIPHITHNSRLKQNLTLSNNHTPSAHVILTSYYSFFPSLNRK